MAVIFLFVDGVGAGERDPARNPLARGDFLLSRFADGSGADLPRGVRATLVDACLGVPGRPQSATGQTTLFTGENAPALLGRHLLGFPNATLVRLLRQRSVFARLAAAGRTVAFANAYPVAYLRALGIPCQGEPEPSLAGKVRRARPSASTVALLAAGGTFRTFEDARRGLALTHDLDGRRARGLGAPLPEHTPREAAAILLGLARDYDLTLFEFFETDEAGHARDMEAALGVLGRLDGLLRELVRTLPEGDSLVVASDHGNLEDLSTRNHTRAPVPLLASGPAAGRIEEVHDLADVAPLLMDLAAGFGSTADDPSGRGSRAHG